MAAANHRIKRSTAFPARIRAERTTSRGADTAVLQLEPRRWLAARRPRRTFSVRTRRVRTRRSTSPSTRYRRKSSPVSAIAAVAETYRRDKEELLDAAEMPGRAFMSSKGLVFRFRSAAAERRVKIAVQQGRLFELSVALPADPPAPLAAEVDALIESFTVFPVNAGCLAASTRAARPYPAYVTRIAKISPDPPSRSTAPRTAARVRGRRSPSPQSSLDTCRCTCRPSTAACGSRAPSARPSSRRSTTSAKNSAAGTRSRRPAFTASSK